MKMIIIFLFLTSLTNLLMCENLKIKNIKNSVEKIGLKKLRTDIYVNGYSDKNFDLFLNKLKQEDFNENLNLKEQIFLNYSGLIQKTINLKRIKEKIFFTNQKNYLDIKNNEIITTKEYLRDNYINSMSISYQIRKATWYQYSDLFNDDFWSLSIFDDRKLALMAGLYGDCTYTMLKHGEFTPNLMRGSKHSNSLLSYLPVSNITTIFGLSEKLSKMLLMPFFEGLDFIDFLYKTKNRKKQKRMDKLFKKPPVTSSEILHPQKYLDDFKAVEVSLKYIPENSKLFHSGVMGEFLLNLFLNPDKENGISLIGWQGDVFKIYQADNNQYIYYYKLVWNSISGNTKVYNRFKNVLSNIYQIRFINDKKRMFHAGESRGEYFFLFKNPKSMIFVRTKNRKEINDFINGGKYD